MQNSFLIRQISLITLCITLAGCASTQPVTYSGLDSAARLQPYVEDTSDHIPYRFSTQTDWRKYSSAILSPVIIYKGIDNQFDEISEEDKLSLADYMRDKFTEKLKERFKISDQPSPNTIRIKLTLTGAKSNTPFLSTFTRFDIAGGLYNIVQSVRGGEGSFTGSVSYAVEIFDASTNALLDAYVAKQYPMPLNIAASMGSMSAAQTGIEKGADSLISEHAVAIGALPPIHKDPFDRLLL
ncbi:DUF3313 family protein [Methylomonas paludis]|uniref:DUF3313 family protein n=1 Tax=Methylomonas paludis TaxID=1173101 RepID=A0A975RBD7_9GAMM|nr:DUF3313 domain-containing protein [Methylomonas paludis]QWF72303.1 DUF3313 family protein [Methylomonas paludis]